MFLFFLKRHLGWGGDFGFFFFGFLGFLTFFSLALRAGNVPSDRYDLLTVAGLATPSHELFSFLFDYVDRAKERRVREAAFLQM